MPYTSEKIKIAGTKYDRRIKLTPEQRDEIRLSTGSLSFIAKQYGVSKRLVMFIRNPEKHEKNLADRKARGGSMQYYKKELQAQYTRGTRRYKQELYLKGKIR